MSEAVTTFRRSAKVGKYRVEWIWQIVAGKPVSSECCWDPTVPSGLSSRAANRLLREYKVKRNAALTSLAEYLGGPVAVAGYDGKTFEPVVAYPDGRIEVIAGGVAAMSSRGPGEKNGNARLTRYPYVCRFRQLGPLAGQPCRLLRLFPLAITVMVEFPNGEVRRVPAQTVRQLRTQQEGSTDG